MTSIMNSAENSNGSIRPRRDRARPLPRRPDSFSRRLGSRAELFFFYFLHAILGGALTTVLPRIDVFVIQFNKRRRNFPGTFSTHPPLVCRSVAVEKLITTVCYVRSCLSSPSAGPEVFQRSLNRKRLNCVRRPRRAVTRIILLLFFTGSESFFFWENTNRRKVFAIFVVTSRFIRVGFPLRSFRTLATVIPGLRLPTALRCTCPPGLRRSEIESICARSLSGIYSNVDCTRFVPMAGRAHDGIGTTSKRARHT